MSKGKHRDGGAVRHRISLSLAGSKQKDNESYGCSTAQTYKVVAANAFEHLSGSTGKRLKQGD